MSGGVGDSSAGLCAPPGLASPEETGEPREEEPVAAGGDGEDESIGGGVGLAAVAGACCVCLQMEQVRGCLHSEKICILPILACLLSLALCTAGLKWVFVDKIFEYEPPTHLDPKRMGQDLVIVADPTLGLPDFVPRPSAFPTSSLSTGRPEVFLEGDPTTGPFEPQSPKGTRRSPTSPLTFRSNSLAPAGTPTPPRQRKPERPTVPPETTLESNDIYFPKYKMGKMEGGLDCGDSILYKLISLDPWACCRSLRLSVGKGIMIEMHAAGVGPESIHTVTVEIDEP
ncbi:hypothetical protein GJAV_G00042670 [Gymnothorax javanicus]|nr:hypothetical protein GJAV_G00042670 [Gymnothorax javanicus]